VQLVLRAVKQQGWVEHRQVVGIKQDDFCKAGCIQGEGFEGIAFYACWLVMGWVWQCGGISACHTTEACLQRNRLVNNLLPRISSLDMSVMQCPFSDWCRNINSLKQGACRTATRLVVLRTCISGAFYLKNSLGVGINLTSNMPDLNRQVTLQLFPE
jgi:hypothetical protein